MDQREDQNKDSGSGGAVQQGDKIFITEHLVEQLQEDFDNYKKIIREILEESGYDESGARFPGVEVGLQAGHPMVKHEQMLMDIEQKELTMNVLEREKRILESLLRRKQMGVVPKGNGPNRTEHILYLNLPKGDFQSPYLHVDGLYEVHLYDNLLKEYESVDKRKMTKLFFDRILMRFDPTSVEDFINWQHDLAMQQLDCIFILNGNKHTGKRDLAMSILDRQLAFYKDTLIRGDIEHSNLKLEAVVINKTIKRSEIILRPDVYEQQIDEFAESFRTVDPKTHVKDLMYDVEFRAYFVELRKMRPESLEEVDRFSKVDCEHAQSDK